MIQTSGDNSLACRNDSDDKTPRYGSRPGEFKVWEGPL